MRRVKRLDEGVRLRVESDDDLWVLAQLCRPGSMVGMLSHRRDSTTGTREGGRARSAERKPMWVLLDAMETAFQPFTDNLRVHGTIKEAKIDIGSHHTHVIGVGDEIEISREGGLPAADLSLLKETALNGSVKLQMRLEFFNLFNTPNFHQPNIIFGTPSFGRVLSAHAGREIQLGVKVIF